MDNANKIGQYEILEELFHGSLTIIYKAYFPVLERTVLIKRLHQRLSAESDIRERFVREAQLCAQINHPNIVEVYDFQATPEATFMVLEYIDGKSLSNLINQEPFTLEVALGISLEILKGLEFAHLKGVVHRDIKPDNILVSKEGRVKISDFGLAFIEGTHTLTRQGMVVGTPAYMSPEQASGKKVDLRSDIFSTGITLFEMLTGINFYKSETLTECIRKIISEPSPKLSDFRQDAPIRLEKVMNKMLEKNPLKRYSNCSEIISEINTIINENKIFLKENLIKEFYQSRMDTVSTGKIKIETTRSQRKKIRLRYISVGIISAIVIMISLGIAFLSRTDQPRPLNSADSSVNNETINSPVFSAGGPSGSENNSGTEIQTNSPVGKTNDKTAERKPSSTVVDELSAKKLQPEAKSNMEPAEATNKEDVNIDETGKEMLEAPAPDLTPGYFTLNANPYAYIYLDGVYKGATPIFEPMEITAGEHQIQFVRPDLGISINRAFRISPGEKKHEVYDLWNYIGRVWIQDFNPWAYLWVDGELLDTIPPFNNPLILSLGKHKIELKNPDFEPWFWEHNFLPGAEPETLSVVLIPKR